MLRIAAPLVALAIAATGSLATGQESPALPRSSPEMQGIASADLLALVEALDAQVDGMHSLIIVRHGHVVAEGWWMPYDAATPHVLFSLSKSFTSIAVGLAAAEGKLSLDDEVLKFFPDEAPAEPSANLKAMRVRDLLRMNTGHESEPNLRESGDRPWTSVFLAHPVPMKPGSRFLYNTPATYMQSAIVQAATGQTVLDYLRPRVFDPLGFEDPHWDTSPQGVSLGGYGFRARTEEIARFGQLMLQKGLWHGRQLVPASYIAEATVLQTSNGSNPNSDWDQGYGYQFWRCRHDGFRGDGAFGQYCVVLPDQDLVVAITSGIRDMQKPLDLIWDKLLPSLRPVALPEDTTAAQALKDRLGRLTLAMPEGRSMSPQAEQVSGRVYVIETGDSPIRAVTLRFADGQALLGVDTADGRQTLTPVGLGRWTSKRGGFTNGLDHGLSVPENPLVAASGAWTGDDTFTVKLALCETPFVSTMRLTFDGDRVTVDSEHNVAFGPTKLPRLEGKADH